MILGFHFIFTAYGFWLPNDPRGSWSDTVRAFNLRRFGPATKVDTTQSLAHQPHNHDQRLAAKRALKYPPVTFTGLQARAIAHGFAAALEERDYVVHALAILPDHVHLVMAMHPRDIDGIAAHLKARATAAMTLETIHPLAAFVSRDGRIPSPWSRNYWCPFLKSEQHVRRAVRYVRSNPLKAGLRAQRWSLVQPLQ